MRCAQCGAVIPAGAVRCAHCGGVVEHPRASEDPGLAAPQMPLHQFVPSPYGPPVRPDIQPGTPETVELDMAPRRAVGYRPVVLPPLPTPQRSGCVRRVLIGLLVLVLLGLASAAIIAHGGPGLPSGLFAKGTPSLARGSVPTAVTPTALPACAIPLVNPSAARALAHSQLTTGLRNSAAHDYRPVDTVTLFHAGQQAYITFEVATQEAGTVGVVFCTAGGRHTGRLTVPAGSMGRYGEFFALFSSKDVGAGEVTVTWNGMPAASVPFTVAP